MTLSANDIIIYCYCVMIMVGSYPRGREETWEDQSATTYQIVEIYMTILCIITYVQCRNNFCTVLLCEYLYLAAFSLAAYEPSLSVRTI